MCLLEIDFFIFLWQVLWTEWRLEIDFLFPLPAGSLTRESEINFIFQQEIHFSSIKRCSVLSSRCLAVFYTGVPLPVNLHTPAEEFCPNVCACEVAT